MVQIPKTVDGGVTSNLGRLAQLLLVSPTREVLPLRGFCEGRESGMLAQVLVITRSDKQSNGTGGIAPEPTDSDNDHASRFSIFAHVSRNATVRLKTGFPGAESGSTQKYPSRSN